MSDAMTPDRARLVELAEAGRTSLASLSAMLGRNPSYLQQFVRKGSPRKLEEADSQSLKLTWSELRNVTDMTDS